MVSPSSIILGKRAELRVIGKCVFTGEIQIPDRALMIVNATDDVGFSCFQSMWELNQFLGGMTEDE